MGWFPLTPADEFEASLRIRYVGGAPYTPKEYDHNLREWFAPAGASLNTARYDPYFRVDLNFLRRFYYERANMVIYLGVNNLLNRKNPQILAYLDDGTTEMLWQFMRMPSGGMILEF